ncbi:Vacuolar membrane protease [Podosphaera aphanis]|nr:Vacuolar membrane protease [Podosphaera aphanis]
MKLHKLLWFTPISVTLITSFVYLSIGLTLVIIHETVPPIPSGSASFRDLNLTQAWLDLQELSNGYHPFNSHRNDQVRDWLLLRIGEILDKNKAGWTVIDSNHERPSELAAAEAHFKEPPTNLTRRNSNVWSHGISPEVIVFNDLVANYTSTTLGSKNNGGRQTGVSTYFEGSNLIVYVRGREDENCEWWKNPSECTKQVGATRGVLVNAHFDSVSTGYGATDDGVGVVTILQLINYFTTTGNRPDRGFVALFNNNEEDGLYGAKAFLSHPMASFVYTFLNLEGAGAGGRATLFRSTDTEVTHAYSKSPHPFGTVVSSEGFSLGFVKSETDYVVFRAEGYRGLDVAFWKPRSRYHTDQDDAKHTSMSSLWHMLSASLETIKYLTVDEHNIAKTQEPNNQGTDGVWFDLFGRYFAVFGLRTLFTGSLTALIITPIILMAITYLLIHKDKYYLFTGLQGCESDPINFRGWHGAFRFPIVFLISSAITVGSAFLTRKLNPLIIYSSPYSVWSMFMTLFFCMLWCLMKGCDAIRPSALHRLYTLIWMFSFSWVLLIAVTVFEDRFQISSGYIFVLYQVVIFLALLIGFCELFALPTKSYVAEFSSNPDVIVSAPQADDDDRGANEELPLPREEQLPLPREEQLPLPHEEQLPLLGEELPLLGSSKSQPRFTFMTFSKGYRRPDSSQNNGGSSQHLERYSHAQEQTWSANLPSWAWILQFIILCPFPLIIIGQVGLMLVDATRQTGADGSSLIFPYLIAATFSIILLLPLAPFIHRITHHISIFLFLVLISTLIYNLVGFPFSSQNRYKIYFQQVIDLDTRQNQVTLVGIEEYVRAIISAIPSAAGQTINCTPRPEIRKGLSFCSYQGITPHVVGKNSTATFPEAWLTYNATRVPNANRATFRIRGQETKACAIRFDQPFSAFHVDGAASQAGRWPDVPITGSDQIKLWHRDWDREWVVDVAWPVSTGRRSGDEGRTGHVVCLWSDQNELGIIPALDEVRRFIPVWATVTKLTDGLVEGRKAFSI